MFLITAKNLVSFFTKSLPDRMKQKATNDICS